MSNTKNEKNASKLGRLAVNIRLLVTGIAVTGGCGLLMLTDSAFNPAQRVQQQPVVKSAAEIKSEEISARNAEVEIAAEEAVQFVQKRFDSELVLAEPTVKKMTFPKYKKAAICDYDMSAAETKSKGFKVNSAAITDPNDFTVPFPEQDTLIYYPEKNEPLNLTATRSVAGEYFRVHDENSGSTLVLNGHELLCLMVNNEIGDSWDEDAIKAQIVAAYSHLRFNQEHGLTPTIGLRYGYSSKLESCVNAVEGQAMHYDGEIINAVYSASSAGYTTTAGDIWNMDYPYLKCVESIYDDQDVNWGIERKYSKAEVKAKLESRFNTTLSDDQTKWFSIDRAYSVVYIDTVTIDGKSECKLTGNQLCNLMDLKSNAITIKYKDGEFIFTSCGWGHGVGMSQWGAHYYAENGWTYDQILMHYYVDAKLELSQPASGSEEPPEESGDSSSAAETNTSPAYTEPSAQTDSSTDYTGYTDYTSQQQTDGYSDTTSQWTDTSASSQTQDWTSDTSADTSQQWTGDTGASQWDSTQSYDGGNNYDGGSGYSNGYDGGWASE